VEPILIEMADAFMTAIEPLRVFRIEPLHSAREGLACKLNQEVEVIRHEDERVKNPRVSGYAFSEQLQKNFAVVIVEKNVLTSIAADSDVPKGAGIFESKRS
jgi:hypothetical protein